MKDRFIKRGSAVECDVDYFEEKGVARTLGEVLSVRGVTKSNFDSFFGSVNDAFHDPLSMSGMAEASETISFVIESGGSVLIYGDYDADGLTASAILSLFFTDNGVDNDVIIPTREEGYGMHCDKIFAAFENKFYDLIITVDCGISNYLEIAELQNSLDAEIIVTDHHELPEILPNCTAVNPKLGYPFAYLSGAGVAFKLVEALAGRETAALYSDLAAIGTIADLMPLTDENRALVKLGLENFNHKGLKKLAELSKCGKAIGAYDIAMKIAPKINAAGRVGFPKAALEFLLARDRTDSKKTEQMIELNDRRKALLDAVIKVSDEQIDAVKARRERLIFLAGESWPHGILGIAASRYREKFNLITLMMTKDGSDYVGSARGVDGIDLFELFSSFKDLLIRFGGHKASVGFSVSGENLYKLKSSLIKALSPYPKELFDKKQYFDAEIDGSIPAADLYAFTKAIEPCLPSDRVVFKIDDYVKYANLFGKENNHLTFTLSGGLELKGFFDYANYFEALKSGAEVSVLCTLEYDDYSKSVCGIVDGIELKNSLHFEALFKQSFLRGISFKTDAVFAAEKEIDEVLTSDSVAAVFDDYSTFCAYAEKHNLDDFNVDFFCGKYYSAKTVVIAPFECYDFTRFEKAVVFAGSDMVRNISKKEVLYARIACSDEAMYRINMDRGVCVAVYTALRAKDRFDSVKGVFDKYLAGKMCYEQFLAVLKIFDELKIAFVKDAYTVEMTEGVKFDLNDSLLYRFLSEPKTLAV